jgi:RND family efflux transporter MFP subunit
MLGMSSCKNQQADDPLSDKVQVKTVIVKKIKTSFPVHTSGILASKQEIKLSFKTGGIIKKIYVTEGQQVKKGEILAQLNLTEIQAQVDKAKAMHNKAQRDYKRIEALYNDSVATLENYQDAETALTAARADMQTAEFNLSHAKITAPYAGKILKIMAEPNELTGPGHPVILFGSTNKNWIIKTSITDKDAIKLAINDSSVIQFDAFSQKIFNGYVSLIPSSTDPYTNTLNVEVTLSHSPPSFISGLIATINIYPSTQENYLTIPIDAMIEAAGNTGFVYEVVNKKPVKRRINVEEIRGEQIFITTGLNEGDEIITAGSHYIDAKKEIEIQHD